MRKVMIGISMAAAVTAAMFLLKRPSSDEVQQTNINAFTLGEDEAEPLALTRLDPAASNYTNEDKTRSEIQNASSFAEDYDRFMEKYNRPKIPEFAKAGFQDQESYAAALEEEWRFLTIKYEEHMTSFLRDEIKLSEDQIQKILATEELFRDEFADLYRTKVEDDDAAAQQREVARTLNQKRHADFLMIVSAAELNEIELERTRFFRAAKERYQLKVLDFPH